MMSDNDSKTLAVLVSQTQTILNDLKDIKTSFANLFDNYNNMNLRLTQLETEHKQFTKADSIMPAHCDTKPEDENNTTGWLAILKPKILLLLIILSLVAGTPIVLAIFALKGIII
jgi:hypothetical protein